MLKKKFYLILVLFLFFILSACSFKLRPYKSNDVLLADDFSEAIHNWDTYKGKEESAVTYYQDGLLILLNAEQTDRITTVSGIFPEVEISVTAKKISGSDNNVFGIICRYTSDRNYYGFLITSDGYYGIFKVFEGEYILLNSDNLQFSKHIRQGKIQNQLEAVCSSNYLILRVNNIDLSIVSDHSFSSGKTGLFAGTYGEKNTAVLFDNYVVIHP
jgi:hypothetical protein